MKRWFLAHLSKRGSLIFFSQLRRAIQPQIALQRKSQSKYFWKGPEGMQETMLSQCTQCDCFGPHASQALCWPHTHRPYPLALARSGPAAQGLQSHWVGSAVVMDAIDFFLPRSCSCCFSLLMGREKWFHGRERVPQPGQFCPPLRWYHWHHYSHMPTACAPPSFPSVCSHRRKTTGMVSVPLSDLQECLDCTMCLKRAAWCASLI